jgi:hypothetical protein
MFERGEVLSYCTLMERNLRNGDGRMLRENIVTMRFHAEHGRLPNLGELITAMGANTQDDSTRGDH